MTLLDPDLEPSPSLTDEPRTSIMRSVESSTYARGSCIYCGGAARGLFCAGHRDLPAVDPTLGLVAAIVHELEHGGGA